MESEKRGLQEELNRMENRSTKLELQRMSTEGDLQRLQMIVQEKDATIQVTNKCVSFCKQFKVLFQKLQEKCDVQSRTLASLEERCASLKSTIDQLNLSLERAAAGENELRAEIQNMQRQLLDSTSVSHSSAEKLKQVILILLDCYFQ